MNDQTIINFASQAGLFHMLSADNLRAFAASCIRDQAARCDCGPTCEDKRDGCRYTREQEAQPAPCKRCGGSGWVMLGYGESAGADECPVCTSDGAAQPAAQEPTDAKDAARWRMLPAFFEEYQIDAMKLFRDIDEALAAEPAAQEPSKLFTAARTITAGDGLPYMTLRFDTLAETYAANDELNRLAAQPPSAPPTECTTCGALVVGIAPQEPGQS